eukprot:6191652-Pleurochrysis_carterae.AAC.1
MSRAFRLGQRYTRHADAIGAQGPPRGRLREYCLFQHDIKVGCELSLAKSVQFKTFLAKVKAVLKKQKHNSGGGDSESMLRKMIKRQLGCERTNAAMLSWHPRKY